MQLLKRRITAGAALLLAALVLAGCGSKDAHLQEGISLMQENHYKKAAAEFEAALEDSGPVSGILAGKDADTQARQYLAVCYFRQGEYRKAQELYDELLGDAGDAAESDTYVRRGQVKLAQGEVEAAKVDLTKAISLDPENDALVYEIAQILVQYDQEDYAKELVEAQLQSRGEEMDSTVRTRMQNFAGQYDEVIGTLSGKSSLTVSEAEILATAYIRSGKSDQAVSLLEKYEGKFDRHPELLNALGLAQLAQKQYAEAEKSFVRGIDADPSDQDLLESLRFNQVVAREYSADFGGAQKLLEAYLKDYPGDQTALREETFLKSRTINPEWLPQAIEDSKKKAQEEAEEAAGGDSSAETASTEQ